MIDLNQAFEHMERVIDQGAEQCTHLGAFEAARQLGMVELGDGKPSQNHEFELIQDNARLWFRWRWYDQSQAFSIRPDRNFLTIKLFDGDKVVREAGREYEDA